MFGRNKLLLNRILVVVVLNFNTEPSVWAMPIGQIESSNETSSEADGVFMDAPVSVHNATFIPKDLVVIKTLIYEIGFLTDPDPIEEESSQTKEQFDFNYFQPPRQSSSRNWWKPLSNNASKINNNSLKFTKLIPLDEKIMTTDELENVSTVNITLNDINPVLPLNDANV